MNFLIKFLSGIGALVFIVSGITGTMRPFGEFIQHGTILRIFEVILGLVLLYNVSRLK
jgi:hypothetical protein